MTPEEIHGSLPSKKCKQPASIGKATVFVFFFFGWGRVRDVTIIDLLEKGKTINRQYYASELGQLKEEIKSKSRGKEAEGKSAFDSGQRTRSRSSSCSRFSVYPNH